MSTRFIATRDPADAAIDALSARVPDNPFYTRAYVRHRRAIGDEAWLIGLATGDDVHLGCIGFVRAGRLNCSLDLPSIPPGGDDFWSALTDHCRSAGITRLMADSFAARASSIPPLPGETERRRRVEYVLALQSPDLFRKMRKGHAYSVKRARKAGLSLYRTEDAEACEVHARLIEASMKRRHERGEPVGIRARPDLFRGLVEVGAAAIYQARLGGEVLSSNLILRAPAAGYNHTQGTSPEGMECGAAQFLVHAIAGSLRDEGKATFNLGGTDQPDSSLARFKTGFGATTATVELEAVECAFPAGMLGLAKAALRSIRVRPPVVHADA